MKTSMLVGAIFLTILLAYLGAHAALYFLLVRFFIITSPQTKLILAAGLALLAASFFLATWLTHRFENIFTHGLYFASGTWIGFLVNLLLFFFLALIVVNLFGQLNSHSKIIATLAILAAVIYSAYGIWNAFTPQVTNINVTLNNLPTQWKGKKIVQISDVHLGHIYDENYMSKVVDQINALKPDMILITGDLFDGADGNLQKFVAPLSKLSAPDGIYFITGNHEIYLGQQNALNVIAQTSIQHLPDQMKIINGLQLIGIDYPAARNGSKDIGSIIQNMQGFDPQKPSILMWHTPTQIEAAQKAGISLELCGHTHKGQLFPFGIISYYSFNGYDYGLKQLGNFSIYTSSGLGGWGPPMRTEKSSEIVQITLN